MKFYGDDDGATVLVIVIIIIIIIPGSRIKLLHIQTVEMQCSV